MRKGAEPRIHTRRRSPGPLLVCLALVLAAAPVPADTLFGQGDNGIPHGPHAQSLSLGASFGRVEGLGDDLAVLAGPDNRAIILEVSQSSYVTPYASENMQLSAILVNDFNLVQGSYGWRWSTVPFPRTFLRPWVGLYITLNGLEDLRETDPVSEEEDFDGIGLGMAAAIGVTVRLDKSLALEASLRGDQIFTSGWLDTGEYYSDSFRVNGVYMRVLYFLRQ